MNEHMQMIGKKLDHLRRMQTYLTYSLEQARLIVPIDSWESLTSEQHETLAAFRVRFSEFQEHLGKTMRAIAIEEEQRTEPFTAVLLYMEKLGVIESAQGWKELRELRNAINHEYEENPQRLAAFFLDLVQSTPTLMDWHLHLTEFFASAVTAAMVRPERSLRRPAGADFRKPFSCPVFSVAMTLNHDHPDEYCPQL
jgi:hypothetical protein